MRSAGGCPAGQPQGGTGPVRAPRPTWSPATGEASVTRVEELQAPDVRTIPIRQPNRIPGGVGVGFALLLAASHGNER